MKEQITELRIKIDGLAQLTKELKPIKTGWVGEPIPNVDKVGINSKEIKKTYDSLILAKAWLGKCLQQLGESTPYSNDGKRKTVKDIEPTADKAPTEINGFKLDTMWRIEGLNREPNYIEKVDWIREEIKKTIDNLPDYQSYLDDIIHEKEIECATKEDFADLDFSDIPNLEPELTFVYQHLSESRFWMGFELSRIRDNDTA
jgi:hypothetical protein